MNRRRFPSVVPALSAAAALPKAIHEAERRIESPIFLLGRLGLAGKDPVVEATRAYR